MSTPRTTTTTRPIEKLAMAAARCSKESAGYGKCIAADYNNVSKDKCLVEFLKLKDCFRVNKRMYK